MPSFPCLLRPFALPRDICLQMLDSLQHGVWFLTCSANLLSCYHAKARELKLARGLVASMELPLEWRAVHTSTIKQFGIPTRENGAYLEALGRPSGELHMCGMEAFLRFNMEPPQFITCIPANRFEIFALDPLELGCHDASLPSRRSPSAGGTPHRWATGFGLTLKSDLEMGG